MEKIRLLVVDDSAVICKIITDCFKSDPEIEVVGTAHSGIAALERISALKPDVVTLDIEMPEMDGLQTLAHIRSTDSKTPIIMFSKFTSEGALATLTALELGANDFVSKPHTRDGKCSARQQVKSQLSARIRALGRRARKSSNQSGVTAANTSTVLEHGGISAIGIAVSTGGPKILLQLASLLSPDLAVPIFITQHMPPVFTGLLAERLSSRGALPAYEASDGLIPLPGSLYVAPGDFHLEVERQGEGVAIRTHQGEPENSCRPSADVMFRSLAQAYGSRVLAIVLTGMGADGKRGCEALKSQGAAVIAQNEASSIVWGMPRSIVSAGLADEVLSPEEIAARINQIIISEE
jgi:two-component system chemotaxis response regulator CheB